MHKSKVDAESFVKMWQSVGTMAEFVKSTKMPAAAASSRARLYRRKGIKLKKFADRRGAPRLDIARLASLADSMRASMSKGRKKTVAAKRVRKTKRSAK